jgi:hypothetical protein
MKKLFTELEFLQAQSKDLLSLECYTCNKTFKRMKADIKNVSHEKSRNAVKYCSNECVGLAKRNKKKMVCEQCYNIFMKSPSQIKKTKHHFCSRSCAATYTNTHKTKGTRVSKLEIYLQKELTTIFPELTFHFNRKDTINSELDIYIPSLNLAFELNGIFHYEPIFGDDKLSQIQNNDQRKFQACLKYNIELCLIDTSSMKYFKKNNAQKYLKIIIHIIQQKLS